MITAILASFIFLAMTIWVQMQLRRERKNRLDQMELIPNCLLTRHPILFVASSRSLFRLFEPWNQIPVFLREHGYEVFVFEPNYRRLFQRRKPVAEQIKDSLAVLAHSSSNIAFKKFHVIADSSSRAVIGKVAMELNPNIASLTVAVADTKQIAVFKIQPASLKPLAIPITELSIGESSASRGDFRFSKSGDPCESTKIFDSGARPPNSWNQSTQGSWNRLALALLSLHNIMGWLCLQMAEPVHPLTVGQIYTPDWQIELSFLRRAVELAESDTRFSEC